MTVRAPRPSWAQTPALEDLVGDPPGSLLHWLCQRFPRISRTTWRQRLEEGLVCDEKGHSLDIDAPFVPRQRIRYFREVPEEVIDSAPIHILYSDERLIVADKPPWTPVTPSGPHVRSCLLYRLVEQLSLDGLTPVHRLDRATSGIVLFSRHASQAAPYADLFARGRVDRVYETLAHCPQFPDRVSWLVENRLVTGEPFFRMQTEGGPPNARTEIELLDWRNGVGHFRLRPSTGKQHQLRIHLAGLGWPILGERYYPELLPEEVDDPENPLRLVATSLGFVDPVSKVERRFESRWRVDLATGELGREGGGNASRRDRRS